MNGERTAVGSEEELIDVLTAISKVSMRLAVKLELLKNKEIVKGGCSREAVRSQSGNRAAYCKARP